jgi:hypothetical protein
VELVQLPIIVTLVVALSVAVERFVEIIKNSIGFLRDKNSDPQKEGYRKVALLVLAVAAGLVTAWLAKPAIEGIVPGEWSRSRGIIALGLLASGGSGFWNSVATYILNLKDIKAAEAEKEQAEAKVVELEADQQIQDLQSVSERR